MWYIVVIIIAAAGLIFGFSGLTSCANNTKPTTNVPPDSIKPGYTREEVNSLLENLANKPVKDNLDMGAMCYSPRPILKSADYICPVCGEKTIYTYQQAEFVQNEIPKCRSLITRFQGATLKLDEQQFCRKCATDSIPEPKLCLLAKLEDQQETKTCGISSEDIKMLTEFFEGKNIHKTSNDGEVALKVNIPRIKQLLGIK
jgi:predicted RNA-binding Zn-ribbon protein involved in translation (DUF1610 family)